MTLYRYTVTYAVRGFVEAGSVDKAKAAAEEYATYKVSDGYALERIDTEISYAEEVQG